MPQVDVSTIEDQFCRYWSSSFCEIANFSHSVFGTDYDSHKPENPHVFKMCLILFKYSDFIMLFNACHI